LQWRIDAWRSGERFADVAARRTLIYRVEQIFLVHRATNRWLLHVTADPTMADDASVFREVDEFAREFFFAHGDTSVEEFFAGEKRVWLAFGPQAYLAAVIGGGPPNELREMLARTVARIHATHPAALAAFNGDPAPFVGIAPELTACLTSAYRSIPEARAFSLPRIRLPRVTTAVAIGFILVLLSTIFVSVSRAQHHWRSFVARLRAEPGMLVVQENWHPWTASFVRGLRDPLAADPVAIAKNAGVNPAHVRFAWTDYTADEPPIVRRRFLDRFGPAKDAQITVVNGRVEISGRVPNEWLERVRREATQVPGVKSVVERDVTSFFDPGQALAKFRERFAPPATVRAAVANNTLVLAGRAPYEWIASVRDGATQIAGIKGINGDDLVVDVAPEAVLNLFREHFGVPDGANLNVQNGRLILTGEAPHAWLDQVRREAMQLPGVRVLDDRNIADVDQREFLAAKSDVDRATLLFILNRDTIAPDVGAAITRVAEDIRRSFGAATRMGVNARVELRGYGDAVGTDPANAELSKRRAEAVRRSLINAGIDGSKIHSLGMGTPPAPAPGEKPGAGQFDRRVFFKIVIEP
jgi:OOP family OmpA-OmpF porin